MAFKLPPLPYSKDALAPHMSAETLEYHHGKHHNAYVNKLNEFVEKDASLAGKDLEEIIRTAPKGPVFNNAAQVWNHTFFWNCMKPNGGGGPTGDLKAAIEKSFGSVADFQAKFNAAAVGQFGSGWAWLVKKDAGLEIYSTPNAELPLTQGGSALLTCDVWEHAYYIDYRNDRAKFVQTWWNVVNWDFVAENFKN
jgi:Fe-Mn family superoxide dismutase